jgi:NADPH-dependent glutamate synthase beta subunit-like oxidoreductase/NAD(P)H-flavin reductase
MSSARAAETAGSAARIEVPTQPQPRAPKFSGAALLRIDELYRLDEMFLERLAETTRAQLLQYRKDKSQLSSGQISELLLTCAPVLEDLVAELFSVEQQVHEARVAARTHALVSEFKAQFVQRRARKRVAKSETIADFKTLDDWLNARLIEAQLDLSDRELSVARLAIQLVAQGASSAELVETLTRWCIGALTTAEGQAAVAGWSSFKSPRAVDPEHLVPIATLENDAAGRFHGPAESYRRRDGFKLTDRRMSERDVFNELHYCVLCHDHAGDFCTRGFPEKKGQPEKGLKVNALGVALTGCPLEEKISEMNTLKRAGHTLGALAMVMADNPMCPVTGHRICNDCMKACIYQKHEPVNIPQIETRCLTDVLALPWGVEIYDLFTRWNPLRDRQWLPRRYNGLKVLICGMGPAGFTLAHHLLMEGFAVVGVDGLKIEPLARELVVQPVRSYKQLEEELDERVMTGFGGVAESGITVRWDKNFLKLIYLSLSRREHFQVFGGVRFGGTVTVDEAWALGFDHLVIAVGAGLPQALPIPGSLAIGMRQANDFLMALQLSGAAKSDSLANLQVRLPAMVIGGGLTGVDTATEVQAYYITQVEKTLTRYELLSAARGEDYVRSGLDTASAKILDEYLEHGRAVRAERERARRAGEAPNFIPLLRQWGGVTIVYRRRMQDSPAYTRNHEELSKALEEGIFYAEALEPKEAHLDAFGHIDGMIFSKQTRGDDGTWTASGEDVRFAARTVLVATGARPNVAYEFEHRGHFKKDQGHYEPHREIDGALVPVPVAAHLKEADIGVFTGYESGQKRVSYIGDTHPVFHGSVVGAVASGMRAYPAIVQHFGVQARQSGDVEEYNRFRASMQSHLEAHVLAITRIAPQVVELTVRAPLAARRFRAGQFFRLQTFESRAGRTHGTVMQGETLPLTGSAADPERGTVSLIVHEKGASARLIKTLRCGDPITLMGPTGVRARIAEAATVMIVTEGFGHAHILATGAALRSKGSRVLHIALFDSADEVYLREELEAAADVTLWVTARGSPVSHCRPQDRAVTGEVISVLRQYAVGMLGRPDLPLSEVQQILIQASNCTIRAFKQARAQELAPFFDGKAPPITASINTPIQCGLKGVCAQCLHWQVDAAGRRTKAVFGCSWQDQPLDIVDLDNVDARLGQNRLQEHLTNLWVEHLERTQASVNLRERWCAYLNGFAGEQSLVEL